MCEAQPLNHSFVSDNVLPNALTLYTFKHDKELIKEIPLIRFIAEEIIISTSNIIEE